MISLFPVFRLYSNEAVTDGVIKKLSCDSHNSVAYHYTVIGFGSIEGSETFGGCRTAKVGDKIKVYYSSQYPRVSILRSPLSSVLNEFVSIFAASICLPTFFIIAYERRRNK